MPGMNFQMLSAGHPHGLESWCDFSGALSSWRMEKVHATMVTLWAAGAEYVDAKNIPEAHSVSTYIPLR